MNSLRLSLCLSIFALVMSGCSSDTSGDASEERMKAMAGGDLKAVVPVSGTVTVDGQPAAGVTISVHPSGGGQELRQTMSKPDGTFSWTTYKLDDGIEPGNYTVTFKQLTKQRRNDKFDPKDDKLGGRFSNSRKSTFKLDVAAGAPMTNVVFDLKTK